MIEERAYTKRELADTLYSSKIKPASRTKALWREINSCPELLQALKRLRWNPRGSGFTSRQIIVLKELLCRD